MADILIELQTTIDRLELLAHKLLLFGADLYRSGRQVDAIEVSNVGGPIRDRIRELSNDKGSIEIYRNRLREAENEEQKKTAQLGIDTYTKSAIGILRTTPRLERRADEVYERLKAAPNKPDEAEEEEEKPKPKQTPKPAEKKPVQKTSPTKTTTPKPDKTEEDETRAAQLRDLDEEDPARLRPQQIAKYGEILKRIESALDRFNKKIPAAQQAMYDEVRLELRRLDLNGDRIKPTVANLKIVNSIRNKLQRLIITDEYKAEVKEFIKAFNDVTKLQNEYWRGIEKDFSPRPFLKAIKIQAISDTVKQLGEAGIGTNIGTAITNILRTNITTGGSYKQLEKQLKGSLTDTETDGLLTRYAKQITVDSINQYSAQYTNIVSGDLGFEWYGYQGSDIKTTRPFCDAMTDFRYFHISEVPRLLRAEDLYYEKEGVRTKVPIYPKTNLPHGLIDGTNAENFFIRRGGYNCGHQIRPVSEKLVPQDIKDRVFATDAYKRWKG